MKFRIILPLVFLASTAAPPIQCQEEKTILHVITVVSRPEGGFLVEAKNKNIYYYLSCTHKSMCMRFHAGRDYEGSIRLSPTGEPNFIPKDAPMFPAKSSEDGSTSDIVVSFVIDGESEVLVGINGTHKANQVS